MVSVNITVVVEIVLFLLFLWVVNRTVFRPLLRVMDGRAEKMSQLHGAGAASRAEADRLKAEYIARLTELNQGVAERLRTTRLSTYRENRVCMDDLRSQAEADLLAHRVKLAKQLEEERAKFDELVPTLVEGMDRQIRSEGSLL